MPGGRPRYGDREDREDRRGEREDQGPSRADMTDDWGAARKFQPSDSFGGGGERGRYGDRDRDRGFGGSFHERDGSRDRRDEGPSRADIAGDWGTNKQFVPGAAGPSGRGFEDRGRAGGGFGERRSFRDGSRDRYGEGGFRESFREPSRADTEDRWERRGGDAAPTGFEDRRREQEDERPGRRGFGEGGFSGSFRERDTSADRWGRAAPPPAGGSDDGATRERPRLHLAPRTVPADGAAAAQPVGASRSSVFGAARPREDVLKEQGRDALQEEVVRDEEHHKQEAALVARERDEARRRERGGPQPGPREPVERPESKEERELKQQITDLQAGRGEGLRWLAARVGGPLVMASAARQVLQQVHLQPSLQAFPIAPAPSLTLCRCVWPPARVTWRWERRRPRRRARSQGRQSRLRWKPWRRGCPSCSLNWTTRRGRKRPRARDHAAPRPRQPTAGDGARARPRAARVAVRIARAAAPSGAASARTGAATPRRPRAATAAAIVRTAPLAARAAGEGATAAG